ncbi:hypothetical protein Tco_0526887 [Tanacetum coccineum]
MPEDPYAYVVAAFQAPPSPDYVPGSEEPEQAPPSPVYVPYIPEPVYPEFMPPEDEILLTEEQPLPVALSPTADSPCYVPESDPKEDPEEDDDEDPEEDRGDEEEEEEHPAPADSTAVALLAVDHAPSAEETEPFETDELLAIPTLPLSPHSPWSSSLPQIPSPPLPLILSPLPVSPPLPVSSPPPASPIRPLGYPAIRCTIIRDTTTVTHTSPTPSPPLLLPSTNRREDRPEVALQPQKRLGIALGLRYEVGESSSAAAARPTGCSRANYGFVATLDREIRRDLERYVGYGITDTYDDMLEDMPAEPATDDIELGQRMIEFATRVRQDTDEIYTRLDDEQTERLPMAGQLNMLYRDRRAHTRIGLLMEREARMLAGSDYRVAGSGPQETGDDYRMTEFERQQGPAKGPVQPDAPEEAGSSS